MKYFLDLIMLRLPKDAENKNWMAFVVMRVKKIGRLLRPFLSLFAPTLFWTMTSMTLDQL